MATTQAPESQLDVLLRSLTQGGGNNSSRGNSSTAFNPQAGQGIQGLLAQIAGLSKDDAIADSTGILRQISEANMRQNLPSIASSGRGAGLYGSTTQQQLLDNLQAQITVQGQEAIQQNIANYAAASTNANNAIANLNNSSRTQTTQTGQSSSDALKGTAVSLLLSQGLGALRKGGLLGLGGGGSDVADAVVSPLTGFADVEGAFGSASNWLDSGSYTGPGTDSLGSAFGDNGIIDTIGGGIGDFFGGIGDAIGGAFSDFGSWTGWWANGGRLPGKEAKDGKDNLVIGAGGGEVILPVDTVKALDAKLGEDWVEQLIGATHKQVVPDPTKKAQAAAAKAVK